MSSPLSVVFVHQGSEIGGGDLMLETLALELSAEMRVAHYCPVPGPLAERLAAQFPGRCCTYRRPHRLRDIGHVLLAAKSLRHFYRELRGTLLIANAPRGYLYALLATAGTGIPVIQVLHDPIAAEDRASRIVSGLRPPQATVFTSRRACDESAAHVRRRPWAITVPASINSLRIDTCLQRRRRAADGARTFVSVARLQEHKGHAVLLDAFARVVERDPDAHLLCIGGSSVHADVRYPASLRELVQKLGLAERVTFTGFLPDCDVYAAIASSIALVHAATHESLGLSLLEAMYLEKPVLATGAAGPQEIVVDGETGHLVPIGDSVMLAERMLALIERPQDGIRMGRAGRARFEQAFGPDKMVEGYRRLMNEVAAAQEARADTLKSPGAAARFIRQLARRERVRQVVLPLTRHALRRRVVTVRAGLAAGIRLAGVDGNPGYVLGAAEPAVQALLAERLRPGDVFYDIGANIGYHALAAARLVGPSGHVYAFEPHPAARALLESNVQMNGLAPVITVIDRALGAESCSGRLGGEHHLTARLLPAGLPVTVERLDQLAAKLRAPTLVKIDVEGAEADVLRGGQRFLARHKPILVCEIHGDTRRECLALLEEMGYRVASLERESRGMPHLVAVPR